MSVEPELLVFVEESDELLASMEATLLRCEKSAPSADDINAIFRAAHTIKGSAGLFGLDFIVGFVHEVETVLDRVRMGSAPMSAPLVIALLGCGDHIRSLVDVLKRGGREADVAQVASGHTLVARIRELAGANTDARPEAVAAAQPSHKGPASPGEGERCATGEWYLAIRFGADVLRNGMDPLSFLRYLATFGELARVLPRADALRAGMEWDPETCYLGFDVLYRSEADRQRIVDAFEFVREDCAIEVIEPHSPAPAYIEALRRVDGANGDVHRLVEVGALTQAELASATTARSMENDAAACPATPVAHAASTAAAGEARSIRIDAAKLDRVRIERAEAASPRLSISSAN